VRIPTRNGWYAVIAALLVVVNQLHAEPLREPISAETMAQPAVADTAVTFVTEGDILSANPLSRHLLLERGMARTTEDDKWPFGLVYYQFDSSLSAADIDLLNHAIDHWNNNTSITILERTDNTIIDYINFVAKEGCASWVGKIGGEQEIWVGPTCNTGSMIHEIGHALGLFHEHTRADRDNHIIVEWDNIKTDKELNFDIISDGIELIGEYDYGSIMHYGTHYFSAAGQSTITVPDGISIGQRQALSPGDISTIATMYQTDLSLLVTQTADEENLSTIDVTVNNNGTRGAHAITFTQPILTTGEESVLDNGAGWECVIDDEQLICDLDVLAAGATTNFSVALLDNETGIDEQQSWISAKNHDPDLSNNGNVPPVSASAQESTDVESSTEESPTPSVPDKETDSETVATTEITDQSTTESAAEIDISVSPDTASTATTTPTNVNNPDSNSTSTQEPALSQAQSIPEAAATGWLSYGWLLLIAFIRRRQLDS